MAVSYTSHSVIVTQLLIGIAVLFEELTCNLKYFLIECLSPVTPNGLSKFLKLYKFWTLILFL